MSWVKEDLTEASKINSSGYENLKIKALEK
jgi:hypothetical protein